MIQYEKRGEVEKELKIRYSEGNTQHSTDNTVRIVIIKRNIVHQEDR